MAIDARTILFQFSAQDSLSPVAKQVVAELQQVEIETGKADAELQRLGLSTKSNVQSLGSQAQVLTQVSTGMQQGAVATSGLAQATSQVAQSSQVHSLAAKEEANSQNLVNDAIRGGVQGNLGFLDSLGGIGAAAVTASAVISQLIETVNKYVEAGTQAEKANAAMTATLQANNFDAQNQISIIEVGASSFAKYGLSVSQVEDISSKMSPVISDGATQLRAIKDAADLAAAAHIDTAQAATLVQRAYEQGGTALHRYGVYIDTTARGVDVLTALEQKYGGVADEVARTGAGSLDHLAASQANLDEVTGKYFVDATKGWNDQRANFNDVISEQIQNGNKFAGTLSAIDSVTLDIPAKLANIGIAATGMGADLRSFDSMTQQFLKDNDGMGVALGEFKDAAGNTYTAVNNKFVQVKQSADDLSKSIRDNASALEQLDEEAHRGISSTASAPVRAETLAQNTFDEFMQQNAFAQTTTAQQNELTQATDRYNATLKSLTDTQKALQIELRDDSTPALAAARRDLDAATKNLDDTTKRYTDSLNALNEAKYQAQQDEQNALNQPQRDLSSAQSTLKDQQGAQNKLLSDLNDKLYTAQQRVTQATNAEAAALAPLKTGLDNATNATNQAIAAQTAMDDAYRHAERAIQVQIEAIQELAYQTLTPLKKEIDSYTEKLYQVNLAEQQALRPIQAAIYDQGLALKAAQDAASALADKYARELNPLQAEYNRLQQQATQAQQAKTLHDEALNVENLTARLASATKGSSDYLSIQQQLAQAQTKQGQDTALFSLQDRIAAITQERDAAMQAAQARVQQEQKALDALNAQQAAVTHRYDLEKQGIQDVLDAKQHEYNLDQQGFQDEESALQHRLTGIQQEQAAYDFAQQDKINQLRGVQDEAQNAYDTQKKYQDSLVLAAQTTVTTLQNTIGWYQQQFKGQNADLQTTVNNAQLAVDQIKAYYEGPDGIITLLDKKITKEQHDATVFEQSLKDQVASAQAHYKDVRAEVQTTIDKIGDQITKVQNTATETETAANRAITAEKAKQAALLNTLAIINAIENLIKSGGSYDPAKLADFYKQAGIKDPNAIPGTPVGGDPSKNQPTQPPTTPPTHQPGEPVHIPGIGGQSVGFVPARFNGNALAPVSAHALGASGAGGGGRTNNVTMQFNFPGLTGTDLMNPQTWRKVGITAMQGIQDALGMQYGSRIVIEGL